MKISTEISGGFRKTTDWLRKIQSQGTDRILHQVGEMGEKALSAATPKGETGETAKGWRRRVTRDEVAFVNVAHPGEDINIAKAIETGHGTGTGGYVPPRPYIRQAMIPVWDEASKMIDKELRS